MTRKNPAPPSTAVALHYNGTGAPRVTAQGRGPVAEQILARAEEHDIPLYRDSGLVQLLAQVELGEEIPATLYEAVAQVLAFVYRLSGETPAHLRKD